VFEIIQSWIKKFVEFLTLKSLEKSIQESYFCPIYNSIVNIVPDISDQYSSFKVSGKFLERKVRNMHSFQVMLAEKAIDKIKSPFIVDIGDSSGTHTKYLMTRNKDKLGIHFLSINLDKSAVDRINKKGFRATQSRAEDLEKHDIHADVFLCFEILEHLFDPISFLKKISHSSKTKYMVITVPYVKKSRLGLQFIRTHKFSCVNAENTHIFELSPNDWRLLFKFAGWEVEHDKIYLQYPHRSLLWLTKFYWKKYDFEGFYGAILKKNDTLSGIYSDWNS
jgi:2-polyprenyl-3-methyl-5-hydroxy-6-metoxy-1,4-benzoquinol methylase